MQREIVLVIMAFVVMGLILDLGYLGSKNSEKCPPED
jgi:hypothetical protein